MEKEPILEPNMEPSKEPNKEPSKEPQNLKNETPPTLEVLEVENLTLKAELEKMKLENIQKENEYLKSEIKKLKTHLPPEGEGSEGEKIDPLKLFEGVDTNE